MADIETAPEEDQRGTKYFRDDEGNYIGAFVDGAAPPTGAIECSAPATAADKWVISASASEWGGSWQSPPPPAPVLSPDRFAWLLAFTGLDEVWDKLESALKATDRIAYASLKAQRQKPVFHLDVTLAMVTRFRDQAEAAAPGIDLSETAIRAAWDQAAAAEV